VRPAPANATESCFDLLEERGKTHSLEPGARHLYRVYLQKDQLLHVVVEQLGADVRLDLFGAGGEWLTGIDSPNASQGREETLLISSRPGRYTMVVTARSRLQPNEAYLIRKVEVRRVRPGDRERAAALRSYFAARLGDKAALLPALRSTVPALEGTSAPREVRAYAWNELAKAYENHADWRESARCYLRSARLFHRLRLPGQEAKTLIGAGRAEVQISSLARALAHLKQGYSLARATGDEPSEGFAAMHLGQFYADRADPWSAKPYLERAIEIRRSRRDVEGECNAWMVLAQMLKTLGEYEEALKIYQDELQRPSTPRRSRPIVLTELANVYTGLGQPDDALRHLQEALSLQQQGADPYSLANTLVGFGVAYSLKKDLDDALSSYTRALAIYESLGDARAQATTLMNLGWVLGSLGRHAEATEASLRALSLAREMKQPILEGGALLGLGWTDRLRGDLAGARRRGEEALERIETTRSGIKDQELRLSYFSSFQDAYDFLIQTAMEEYAVRGSRDLLESALEGSERARSRVLLDVLGEREGTVASRLAPVLGARQIQQQVLDPDTILLEYSLGEPESYLLMVTREEIERFELPGRDEIERMARETRTAISESRIPGRRPRAIKRATELSRALLGPVAARLGRKRLLIVASGALELVPLGALPDPAALADWNEDLVWPQPLLLRHEVLLEPSASVLAGLRKARAGRRPPPGLLAVLADAVYEWDDPRLPGASSRRDGRSDPVLGHLSRLLGSRREADGIAAGLPADRVLKALGFAANLDLARSGRLGDQRVLHIAAHTYYSDQRPELSALVLSRWDGRGLPRDGLLRIKDIRSQRLRTDLVVLSSCSSALGREIRGEGVVGWPWAFLSAGASEVVTSLWDVGDDSTADLMQRFYQNMLRGMTPSEALRQSQLWVWNGGKGKGPWFWGGFMAQGEWDIHPLSLNKIPPTGSFQVAARESSL
jgi:CHAT domain-containing protein/tetratricopeptide (TPR) repeat protein